MPFKAKVANFPGIYREQPGELSTWRWGYVVRSAVTSPSVDPLERCPRLSTHLSVSSIRGGRVGVNGLSYCRGRLLDFLPDELLPPTAVRFGVLAFQPDIDHVISGGEDDAGAIPGAKQVHPEVDLSHVLQRDWREVMVVPSTRSSA